MAGIDPVADGAVGVHVDEIAEVRMRDMAVIAFEEIVDRVLPIAGEIVGRAMGENEPIDLRAVAADLAPPIPALAFSDGASGSRLTKTKEAMVSTRTGFRPNASLSKSGRCSLPRAVRRLPSVR